jgi:hypothetical protein
MRLEALLRASGLNQWDQQSIAERCEGWWPSLAAFMAETLSGSKEPVPEELVSMFDEMGQEWLADERITLLPGGGDGEAGVFVIRVGGW